MPPRHPFKVFGALAFMLSVWGCAAPAETAPALPLYMREDLMLSPAPAAHDGSTSAPNCPVSESSTEAPSPQPPAAIALPDAVHECIFHNLVIMAGAESVAQARAGLKQSSLIPNPTLYLDSILNPFPGEHFTPTMQGGPPQADVAVTFPIDWCLFGKRVAAMEASRLGVGVAAADLANLVRVQVTNMVIAFYDLLEANQLLEIARMDLKDAERVAETSRRLIKAGELAPIEDERAGLIVVDARTDLLRREAALKVARAKLAVLLGRLSPEESIEVTGQLTVPHEHESLDLPRALRLAEQNRPDLAALRRRIEQAEAELMSQKRRAYPVVNVQPLATYQFQKDAIGFPDARSWGVALTGTLPFSDRNQGNIDRAFSVQREAVLRMHAELAAIRSEVKQAVDLHAAAVEIAKIENLVAVEAARRLRDKTADAFSKGQEPLLTLLLVRRAYFDRWRLSVSAQADYWRSLQRLNSATGGRALEDCQPFPPPIELLPPPRVDGT